MSLRLRILHLGKFYPPEYGGIESVTEALAEDHARSGNSVKVVCFTNHTSEANINGELAIFRHKSLADVSSQPLSLSYVLDSIREARRVDIVHIHAPNFLAFFAASLSPRNTKIVVHWHADVEQKGILGKIFRPLEGWTLRRADAIVCTSQRYLDASPALQRYKKKSYVIPIGIADLEDQCTGNVRDENFILFVGRLVPYKGVPVLLEAAARMTTGAKIVIVGTGPEERRLKDQARKLGVSERLEFLGSVDYPTLLELINRSSVFCLPSTNRLEAFGVVLLEAMRAGRVVVTSDIPGSGVSWVNSTGLHFPVGDHVSLASLLDGLMQSAQDRDSFGVAARERFLSEFTREKMSYRFLSLYRKICHA